MTPRIGYDYENEVVYKTNYPIRQDRSGSDPDIDNRIIGHRVGLFLVTNTSNIGFGRFGHNKINTTELPKSGVPGLHTT